MEKNFKITSNLVFLLQDQSIDMVDAALVKIDHDSYNGYILLEFISYMGDDRIRLKFEEVELFQWIPNGDLTPGDYHRLDGCGYQDLWYVKQGDSPAIMDDRQPQHNGDAALILIFNDMTLRVYARRCSLSFVDHGAIY